MDFSDQPVVTEQNKTSVKIEVPSVNVKVSKGAVEATGEDGKGEEQQTVMEKYVHMSPELYKNTEHDVFTLAKKNLIKDNDGKSVKVCWQLICTVLVSMHYYSWY